MAANTYKREIRQGDSTSVVEVTPFAVDEATENLSDTGWTCRQLVLNRIGGETVISAAITAKTADDLSYQAYLESPDTENLDAKKYLWVIEVQNLTTTPLYRKEWHVDLTVGRQGAPAATETSTEYAIVSYTGKTVNILDVTLAGSPTRVELKDAAGTIIQTNKFVSDTTVDTDLVITLLEDVIGVPTAICVIS